MWRLNILCLLLFIGDSVFSQHCIPQGIEFNSQSSIDSFQINYPGCTVIEGSVKIKGSGISNLDGLISLIIIEGDLRIDSNPDLTSLNGLSSLTIIGGSLIFVANTALTDVSGLGSLMSVGNDLLFYYNDFKTLNGLGPITYIQRYLKIIGNDSLTNLYGLNHIKSIGAQLTIHSNARLLSLTGLDSLAHIGGGLLIAYNPKLTSLNGLNSMTYIDNSLSIWGNGALNYLSGLDALAFAGVVSIKNNFSLKKLDGLEGLTQIGTSLKINNNDSLENLHGLLSLTSIGQELKIENNTSLKSLTGLDNIASNSISNLYIENNDSLSMCAVKSVCDYLAAPAGAVSIYGNSTGCSTQAEVETACATGGVELDVRVFLQGAYSVNTTMGTNLSGVLPNNQPYDTLPWMYQGMEAIDSIPLGMVDWVLVELRDSADYNSLYDVQAGILLANGYVKDTNLVNGIWFNYIETGHYYVVVRHRNHISVMTDQPIYISSQVQVDFTDTALVKPFGGPLQAQIELEPEVWGMIGGDINQDGKLKYSGPNNDGREIIQTITNVSGSTSITTIVNGYYREDLNFDTEVIYSGVNNDRAWIIQNILNLTGSTSITSVYICPVMFLYP